MILCRTYKPLIIARFGVISLIVLLQLHDTTDTQPQNEEVAVVSHSNTNTYRIGVCRWRGNFGRGPIVLINVLLKEIHSCKCGVYCVL